MKKLYFILATLPVIAVSAKAQDIHPAVTPATVDVINDGNGETTDINIYEIFAENAPKYYRHSVAPRFAIMGKDNKFYLGVGGAVKGTVSYDWGNPIDNPNDFTTYDIPMSVAPGDGGLLQFSAQQSDIFFNMVALPGTSNQLGAYVEIDFDGNNNYTPALSKAYLNYRGITVGYANSLFTDAAACPPTIDGEGPNALADVTNGVVQYEKKFGKGWKFGAAAEMPITSATYGNRASSINQRVPDIPVYIQYGWAGGNGRVRFSAILRNMQYRDAVVMKNKNAAGWGIKLSGTLPIVGPLSAYYQGGFGKGIASYFQDLTGCEMDMVPDGTDAGHMLATKTWGAYAGLQYNFTPNLFMTATYSHLRNYLPANEGLSAESRGAMYSYAQYIVANMFWNVNSFVQCGVEYLYGRRVDMNHAQAHDNRLQMMMQLSF